MKKKTLLLSILSVIMCLSLTVGGTFALFTSESEVNVAVTSATVDVRAYVSKSEYSFDSRLTEASNCTHVINADGGLDINYMMPGDTVTATVAIENKSDIAIKYKVNTTVSGELADYLVVTPAVKGWTSIDAKASIDPQTVVITLPYEEDDANAQGKSASVLITVEAVQGNYVPKWDGSKDTSWYNDQDTTFELSTPEQFVGFASLVDGGNTFEGITIELAGDLDFEAYEEGSNEPISIEPVGSYQENKPFKGTFDGQGNTIYNVYQNGWALKNGYWDGPDWGMGLFALIEDATIKNLTLDGSSLPTEANIIGPLAGLAGGTCRYEDITVKNAYTGNHSWYSGGLIGWAEGNQTFVNCDVDDSVSISSQWGDFNNANGGLIGGIDPAGTYYFEDCDVACRIDAYNDVTSAYEWYSYRSCGMLIGDTGQKDSNNIAIAPNVTCVNVTVTYGEWADYHYCKFSSSAYPFCRVEAGDSTGAYGNARVGEYYDANGNKVVDENHVHNDGEMHNELIVFDQLFGGPTGDRYVTYGNPTHPGVTVTYNNSKKTNN